MEVPEMFQKLSPNVKHGAHWHIHIGRMFGFLTRDPSIELFKPDDIKQDATVTAKRPDQAQALANLLILKSGSLANGPTGVIAVKDAGGEIYAPRAIETQDALYTNLVAAFQTNPRVADIVRVGDDAPAHAQGAVVVVCKKELIVYDADDLSDPYANQSIGSAAALTGAMIDLFKDHVKLIVTTVDERDFG